MDDADTFSTKPNVLSTSTILDIFLRQQLRIGFRIESAKLF